MYVWITNHYFFGAKFCTLVGKQKPWRKACRNFGHTIWTKSCKHEHVRCPPIVICKMKVQHVCCSHRFMQTLGCHMFDEPTNSFTYVVVSSKCHCYLQLFQANVIATYTRKLRFGDHHKHTHWILNVSISNRMSLSLY